MKFGEKAINTSSNSSIQVELQQKLHLDQTGRLEVFKMC